MPRKYVTTKTRIIRLINRLELENPLYLGIMVNHLIVGSQNVINNKDLLPKQGIIAPEFIVGASEVILSELEKK